MRGQDLCCGNRKSSGVLVPEPVIEFDEGREAIRLARNEIHRHLNPGLDEHRSVEEDQYPASWNELRGVFVTLRREEDGMLRGCIGFPLPIHPLRRAIAEAAVSAAVDDPRFPPVRFGELAGLLIEVSILTPPEPLRVKPRSDLPSHILVGRDGLIVEAFGTSGLLLPQVAVEQRWTSEQFLDEACVKAGLPPRTWLDTQAEVHSFRALVYRELAPGGAVIGESMDPEPSPRPARVRPTHST